MTEGDFWSDQQKAQSIMQKSKYLKDKVENYQQLIKDFEDLQILVELGIEDGDSNVVKDVKNLYQSIREELDRLEIATLLAGPYDKNNAIISIHAGAGGLESQDWAEMLMRLYTRWSEQRGYEVVILDILPDYEGGIRNVTLLVKGTNAYGYLKSEKGVHRLVRISPFDTAGRRHTSFASLDVMPEIEEDIEIEINPQHLKIDTYRAGGAGGQHVNKTDSAVRITHLPTGIVVQCQNERSQHTNKETAMKMLKAKLIDLKESEQKEKIDDLKGEYSQIGWGSQIRSYVFHPYNLVKDHRTNAEVGNVHGVMDGDIDYFISEYLKQQTKKQPS